MWLTLASLCMDVFALQEELTLLRQKLQNSENSRSELRQSADLLESKVGLLPHTQIPCLSL